MKRRLVVSGFVVASLAMFSWYLWIVAPKNAPWEEHGTLVMAVHAIPGFPQEDGRALGVNVDDVMLVRDTGEEVRITVLTRHLLLSDTDSTLQSILETTISAGSYVGVRLALSSPEQRNAWTGDMAPTPISLGGEYMALDIPFTVEPEKITALVLGFETHRAVHEHNGVDVYLPVIHVEVRSGATINTIAGSTVEISDGMVLASKMFGMDWDGTTQFNYRAKEGGVLKNTPPSEPEMPEVPPAESGEMRQQRDGATTTPTESASDSNLQ